MYSLPKMRGDNLSPDNLVGVTSGREMVTSDAFSSDKSNRAIRKNRPEPSNNRELFPSALRLAERLRLLILRNNPSAKITPAQIRNWAVTADRMVRLENRSEQQIHDLIEWSQDDDFWRSNILSMGKLREKFDQLTLKRERDQRKRANEDVEDDSDCKLPRPKWTGLERNADEKE